MDTATRAGELLTRHFNHLSMLSVGSKSTDVDLVSQADTEAEDQIREELLGKTPGFSFIGEETAPSSPEAQGYCWVVDPLDGTSNFLCGLPVWSVSIAACGPGFNPLAGVVHAPGINRTWSATAGGGAFCNGRQIYVRKQPPGGGLQNAMLATGFPYDLENNPENRSIRMFSRMQASFHKIRRLGSAAVDLALVAEGVFDGMWERRLHPWDTAAGILMVREAGGLCVRIDGEHYVPGDENMLAAATPELLSRMAAVLAEIND